jgi:hypothetical protein
MPRRRRINWLRGLDGAGHGAGDREEGGADTRRRRTVSEGDMSRQVDMRDDSDEEGVLETVREDVVEQGKGKGRARKLRKGWGWFGKLRLGRVPD